MKCPRCDSEEKQYKNGKTSAGSQRYICTACKKRYTFEKKRRGYSQEYHREVIRLFLLGYRPRRIGRLLSIHHVTVANWIRRYLEELPSDMDLKLNKYQDIP